jgi:hypothetical protein
MFFVVIAVTVIPVYKITIILSYHYVSHTDQTSMQKAVTG